MTDTVSASPSIREYPLDPGGHVELQLTSSELRIRGTDNDRVVVRTRGDRNLADEITIEAAPDHLRIRDIDDGEFRHGRFRLRQRRPPDLDVDVPRTARVSARTLSGAVDASGIAGESRWSSATGALRLHVEAGPVSADTMSGDLVLDSTAALSVTARSMSGDVRIRAPLVDALQVETTSGDVSVDGALGASTAHAISSVSGDVTISTGSAVRLEAQTIAGEIRASTPHRADGGRGRRTIIVGEGRVSVSVKTMSGDIRLRGEQPGPSAQPGSGATTASQPPSLPAEPSSSERPDGASLIELRDAARLDVLRALEQGDLDVETAAHRLEALEDALPSAPGGSDR